MPLSVHTSVWAQCYMNCNHTAADWVGAQAECSHLPSKDCTNTHI